MQETARQWERDDVFTGCGSWFEGANGKWTNDGLVVDALGAVGVITCHTYHLSAFSALEVDVPSDWNTVDLIDGYDVLREVG